jgi:hypothetical protein
VGGVVAGLGQPGSWPNWAKRTRGADITARRAAEVEQVCDQPSGARSQVPDTISRIEANDAGLMRRRDAIAHRSSRSARANPWRHRQSNPSSDNDRKYISRGGFCILPAINSVAARAINALPSHSLRLETST